MWYDGRCDQAAAILAKHPAALKSDALLVLETVEEWTGARLSQIAGIMSWSNGRVRDSLAGLSNLGLLVERDGYWFLSAAGVNLGVGRDQAAASRVHRRFNPERLIALHTDAHARHERGILRMVAGFSASGCAVGGGCRAEDYLPVRRDNESGNARRTTIKPDAMVGLDGGPYGAGWHYLEYELRSRSPSTVTQKLWPYRNIDAGNDYPVLMVCRDERAEALFWQYGEGMRLITSTAEAVRRGPLVGDDTVWSSFGDPVRLGRN